MKALLVLTASALILAGCSTTGPGESAPLVSASDVPVIEITGEPTAQLRDAIRSGDAATVQALIDAGADARADFGLGVQPVHAAAAADAAGAIPILVAAGADPNATTEDGTSALVMAASTGSRATLMALADAGADLDAPGPPPLGTTAWHAAAREGNVDALEFFLDAGTGIDVLEDSHSTALMYAAFHGHLAAVEYLLANGADTEILDNIDTTALQWADSRGHTEVAEALRAAGATG